MTRVRVLVGGAVAAAAFAGDAAAQRSATLAGRVTADSGGAPIRQAAVRLPELGRIAWTDSGGAFRVDELPAGMYGVIAEASGFRARLVRVTLAPGAVTTQDFALGNGPHLLATVDVRAKAPPRVSLKMLDFERRRQRGLGWFVTSEQLRRVPGRHLEEVMRIGIPGARFVKTASGQTWLVSSRQERTSADLLSNGEGGVRANVCHVQVILDGVPISGTSRPRAPRAEPQGGDAHATLSDARTQTEGGDDPLDLEMFLADQLEGVEFYPDATMTPVQYRTAASACGTLLLWTRDK
jgi:Carboxypeptidase regulatory-like domain